MKKIGKESNDEMNMYSGQRDMVEHKVFKYYRRETKEEVWLRLEGDLPLTTLVAKNDGEQRNL